jgi:hypothetical protein
MTTPTDSYDVPTSGITGGGIREDLTNIIEDVSPTETPFMSMIGRGKARNVFHEWQTDALAAAVDDNAVIEGDDATNDAISATTRVGNYCQISDKVIQLTGTVQAVDFAGKQKNVKGYQLMRRSQELKRDMDMQMCSNKASVIPTSAVAAVSGGYECFITTNDSRGTGGSDTGYSGGLWNAPTDGTQRAITEDMLKAVLKLCWDNGGKPTKLICGSFNKQKISGFTGGSTRFDKGEDKRLTAAIDYYISDFCEVQVVPSRFSRSRSVLVVDPTLWSLCYLRKFQTHELAKLGDSDRWQLLVQYCLRGNNELGSGIIADLTTS